MALLACILCGLAVGCSGNHSPPEPSGASARRAAERRPPAKSAPGDPRTIPLPEIRTEVVRVYTPEPGFRVFVDGEPVRSADSRFAETPCAITAPRGNREILVAKEGFADAARPVRIDGETEVVFDSIAPADPTAESILAAPYLDAPVGQPIALRSLNSAGAELDPYVAPDGSSIWFVGRRTEGTGIYVARRPSPFHEFGPPRYLFATGSLEAPATPSLADEGRSLVYALPEKQRIYAWTRTTIDGEFSEQRILQFGRGSNGLWPSCQMLPDGLRLYWTERDGGGALRGKAAVRRSPDEPFAKVLDYPLPGLHPCLSADGLRQYVFDGRRLQRARRADLRDGFSALETIATLELPNYVPSRTRRQFFVTEDEQWLFYSDDPDHGGDLYAVRLFPERHWGPAPVGEPIAPRPQVVASTALPDEKEPPATRPPAKAAHPASHRVLPSDWRPLGPRNWESPAPGEFVAAAGYAPDSYLRSPEQYENFELKLEWKAEGPFGQGGVFFRYPGQGELYGSAFKVHLANDYGLLPDPQCTGSLFGYQAPEENAVRRPGEWNTLVLRVGGESVEVTINGKKVLETIAVDEKIPVRGYIALDGIVGGIAYRGIELVELPPE